MYPRNSGKTGVATLGVASGIGGNHPGCRHGPGVLRDAPGLNERLASGAGGLALDWLDVLDADRTGDPEMALAALTRRIAARTEWLVRCRRPFLVLGGDHSEAMGVWRGVLAAMERPRTFGLLWIDAHMDAHNFATTPSGNIHGMPLAALLGNRDRRLRRMLGSTLFLNPARVLLLGVRSFEPEEARFLDRLRVRVIPMAELVAGGNPAAAIGAVIRRVADSSACFGISIDLDGLDPMDAPAVGTPEPGGIRTRDLSLALATVRGDRRFVGMEIAEFLPAADRGQRTVAAIAQLIGAAFAAPAALPAGRFADSGRARLRAGSRTGSWGRTAPGSGRGSRRCPAPGPGGTPG